MELARLAQQEQLLRLTCGKNQKKYYDNISKYKLNVLILKTKDDKFRLFAEVSSDEIT